MADWTTTKGGLKDYIQIKLVEAICDVYLDEFGIGKSGNFDYKNIESFLCDLDHEFVIKAIKKCWADVSSLPLDCGYQDSDH